MRDDRWQMQCSGEPKLAGVRLKMEAEVIAKQKVATDAQKPIEQLIEQNRKLEQQNQQLMEQNRELMEQINSLRPSLAKQDRTVQSGPVDNSPSPVQPGPPGTPQQAVNQTTDQDSDQ